MPKDLERPRRLSFKAVTMFEPARAERDGEREDEVAEREREVAFEAAEGERRDLLGVLREFLDADDREQRGVFHERGELPGERRERLAEGLRKDDVAIRLRGGESDGARAFPPNSGA